MIEDYKRGFVEGFEAGYKAGKGSTPSTPAWSWPDVLANPPKNKCSVCGIDLNLGKVMGVVCVSSNCTSKVISSVTASGIPDGLSYEEIYGSVVYQQNKKKE